MPLPELTLQAALEVAFHSSSPDVFPPAQAAAVDAIQVLLKHRFLEGFAGSLATQNTREELARLALAVQTLGFGNLDLQQTMPQAPILMPDRTPDPAFIAQVAAAAMSTGSWPAIPGRDLDHSVESVDGGNL